MRPLYHATEPAQLCEHGHRGLWFNKFCDSWRKGNDTWSMRAPKDGENPKLEWLKKVLLPTSCVGAPDQLGAVADRIVRMTHAVGGELRAFRSESRFATGLGLAHPIENGFAWHPTLGTPYLPGSSVKGVVRAWARCEQEAGRVDDKTVARLFGDPLANAGSLCFLDAIPVAPVELEIDVLTPHAGGWDPESPPGDWRSPVPIPFLVVAAEQRFLFSIVPAPGRVRDSTASDLAQAFAWLGDALREEGAGAKTAVGYGRFAEDRDAIEKLRAPIEQEAQAIARAQAMTTPKGRWNILVGEYSEQQLLDTIKNRLEKNTLTDPTERAAFVAAVRHVRGPWLLKWRIKSKFASSTKLGGQKLKMRAKLIDDEP